MIDWNNQKGINLYNDDCMEIMRIMPDGWADIAIVDPPYGIDINKTGKVGGRKLATVTQYDAKEWDNKPPPIEYFIELQRVSKNQIIWGGNYFMHLISKASPCWIVWDKDNTGNFADCELAYTSFNTAVRKFKFTWNGMIQGDMKNKEHRIHICQKPIKLYEWLLTNYAKPGQRILDTHLGSASSAIAAHYFGCEFVGCELDEDYYNAAVERFNNETSQKSLFDVDLKQSDLEQSTLEL